MGMTLEERLDMARSLRAAGHNCSQCVVGAFPDITGEQARGMAIAMATGLGGGVGGTGQVCGALSGVALLQGLRPQVSSGGKGAVYRATSAINDEFNRQAGSTTCATLKSPGAPISCNALIELAVTLLHNQLP